jgi:hypothetical protein
MSELWSWDRCEETLNKLFEALDWEALGKIYFHEDGEEHWEELRPRVIPLGLDWARALLQRVPEGGVSLYAGAGIAELPVMFAERFVRGRRVIASNARLRECEVIEKAIERCGLVGKFKMRHCDVAEPAKQGGYDHLACVSLFTDPESYPWLSAVTYGRIAPVQLQVEAFVAEREKARTLVATMFAGLQKPGLITTTVEEVAWFVEECEKHKIAYAPDEDTLPTAVVGDPIGFMRIG